MSVQGVLLACPVAGSAADTGLLRLPLATLPLDDSTTTFTLQLTVIASDFDLEVRFSEPV